MTPPPTVLFSYITNVFGYSLGGTVATRYVAYMGERGTAYPPSGPVSYFTQRLDLLVGDVADALTAVASLEVVFKNNGSTREVAYWAPALAVNDLACAAAAPLPVPWEAAAFDWLATGTAGAVVSIGNETVYTPVLGNVTAQHWQSPTGCRDVWLAPQPPSNSPPGGPPQYFPVLYSLADAAPDGSCSLHNRSYAYWGVRYLNATAAAQTSSYFAFPSACDAATPSPSAGPTPGGGGTTVSVIWLAIACIIAVVVGGISGMFCARYLHRAARAKSTEDLLDAYARLGRPLVDIQ